ncbi:MAG: response regulator [candidate division Zixibacteria bacterium]|nr:response regulator [candidate division Zixibacteria bacterium]
MASEKEPVKHIDELGNMLRLITKLHKQQKSVGDEREILFHEKKELNKALTCLCGLTSLIGNTSLPLEECFRQALELIQSAWQYPDETSARIFYNDEIFITSNFIVETEWRHQAAVKVEDKIVGRLELFYMEKTPVEFSGILMWERQIMMDAFAAGLGLIIDSYSSKEKQKSLNEVLQKARQIEKKYAAKIARNLPKLKKIKQMADDSILATNRFLSSISGELLGSINTVLSSVENVESEFCQSSEWQKLRASSKHISQIIHQIHNYAEIETKPFKQTNTEFNISQLIADVVTPLSHKARAKGIDLINFTNPIIPEQLIGDSENLTTILTNLIENAINRTESGEIAVGVELEATPHLLPIFHFIVADSGGAIDEDQRPKIFEPFDKDAVGLSSYDIHCRLGRSISKKLVEFMGGEIWIEDSFHYDKENHNGTTVHFTMWMDILPNQEKEIATLDIDSISVNALVIEKNEIYRRFYRILLENSGLNPIFADDYEMAVLLIDNPNFQENPIEVAFLRDTSQQITSNHFIDFLQDRQNEYDIPVIAVVEDAIEDFNVPENSPVVSLLTKPLNHDDVLVVLHPIIKSILDNIEKPEPEPEPESEDATEQHQEFANETQEIPLEVTPSANILMAENDDSRRIIIEKLLTKRGYGVRLFSDGREAIDEIRNGKYDILIIDIDVPVIGGLEVIKLVRDWEKRNETLISIIAITGEQDELEGKMSLDAGADKCLSEPLNVKSILSQISTLMNRVANTDEEEPLEVPDNLTIDMAGVMRFDSDEALKLIDNDDDMLIELLDIFAQDSRAITDQLDNAIAAENKSEAMTQAGSLSRAANSVGAKTINLICSHIIAFAAKDDYIQLKAMIEKLHEELAAFNREARIFEQSCQQENQPATKAP